MSEGSRSFIGPDGLLIIAMLDHDDAQRPALTIIGWFPDRTRVEVTYSWGDTTHHSGLPVEFWCETMLRVLTQEQAVEIIMSVLTVDPAVISMRRQRP